MAVLINHNGKIKSEGEICISPNNRSFRYGDGFFETMKMIDGKIILQDLHVERLFRSLELLQFKTPTHFSTEYFVSQIIDLAHQNGHSNLARIRCTFFRGEGGLHDELDHTPNFIIQSWPANQQVNEWQEAGLIVSIYKDARKSADLFSASKSNNFLPYILGAIHAKKKKVDDCIILNPFDNICDATIANVFIVINGIVITPPLSDGPVDGVMRRHLLRNMRQQSIPVHERTITIEELLQASEVFFTNAMFGMKWIRQVDESMYQSQLSSHLYHQFVNPLFQP